MKKQYKVAVLLSKGDKGFFEEAKSVAGQQCRNRIL